VEACYDGVCSIGGDTGGQDDSKNDSCAPAPLSAGLHGGDRSTCRSTRVHAHTAFAPERSCIEMRNAMGKLCGFHLQSEQVVVTEAVGESYSERRAAQVSGYPAHFKMLDGQQKHPRQRIEKRHLLGHANTLAPWKNLRPLQETQDTSC
jgi:hypothetical protein